MQTPKGNEYTIVEGVIYARIGNLPTTEFEAFDSVEDVDAAFENAIVDESGNIREEFFKFKLILTTTQEIPGQKIKKILRIVFASSSEVAGLNRQETRLRKTAESALIGLEKQAIEIGANAIIGITVSANSSQGGSSALFGSSDAVLAMGTAVLLEEIKSD